MNKNILLAGVCLLIAMAACHKWDDYKKYQAGGEKKYPGKGDSVIVQSGKNKVLITWLLNADPGVTKYKLYWNGRTDSMTGAIPSNAIGDTFKIVVDRLAEGLYNFELCSLDNSGNLSVANIFTGKAIGAIYQNSLLNRTVASSDYSSNIVVLNWNVPDTINIATQIKYISTNGDSASVVLSPDSSKIQIGDWKTGTKIYYRSSYKPDRSVIDTFYVTQYDSLTVTAQVDKSLWKQVNLPNDVVTNAYGTDLSYIWDGQPGGYPDIYHTDEKSIPHHFTFDFGKIYNNLSQFAEWGRQDCSCHNPDDFEVWGIADTANAATTLQAGDPGWLAESVAKGWTLLTNVKRTDDGIAEVISPIAGNPPPVRYIRIRVLHTVDNALGSHMSEVSFWYIP
jgi:hypothetical protein